jgi:hypothetical protein
MLAVGAGGLPPLWSPAAVDLRPMDRPVYPIGDLRSLAPIPYAAPSQGQDTGHVHPRGQPSRPVSDAAGRR